MTLFIQAHATHPDWRMALTLVVTQLQARIDEAAAGAVDPTLGFVYFTDHYAPQADELVAALRRQWPAVAWAGTVGVGVCASGVEYVDEPALVLMLSTMPAGLFRVFSGARPLSGFDAYTALVHADPMTPDLAELIGEMSDRTASGYLFGGLASSRAGTLQIADGVRRGGLSGVAFGRQVPLLSRVTQGSRPVGPVRRVTRAERNLALELDGRPALECLVADLGIDLAAPQSAVQRLRQTLVGLTDSRDTALAWPGQFGADTRVRSLIGIDPATGAVALGEVVEAGLQLAFCERNVDAARRDLVRICSEIREELEAPAEAADAAAAGDGASPRRILGAVYVSCAGRGGPHFGGPSAELQIVRHALGDVPLVGFFAAGEIARHHLYGYTGVLTVFTSEG